MENFHKGIIYVTIALRRVIVKFLIFIMLFLLTIKSTNIPPHKRHRSARFMTLLLASATIFSAIYPFLPGPLWPTGPVIHPNPQDTSMPLSTSFMLQNQSIVFPVHIERVACNIDGEFTSASGGKMRSAGFAFPANIDIPQNGIIPFPCPLDLRMYHPRPFKMYFCIAYNPSMIEFWKKDDLYVSETFYWDNGHFSDSWIGGHWLEGSNFDQEKHVISQEAKHNCEELIHPHSAT